MDSKYIFKGDIMYDYNTSIVSLGDANYLSAVFDKAEKEKELSIVYLGGSITQGCHAQTEDKRYVNLSAKWWEKSFPETKLSFFNAGIGATTSQFGAARADEHVLDKKPDLVFVEFSVNDDNTQLFRETYESLIRKLLKAQSVKAVVVINNLFYEDGHNAQEIHNEIAKHYGLPIVSVRDYIYPHIASGEEKREDYTTDMLHPNDKGHAMIASLICNLLDKELENRVSEPVKPTLKAPVTASRYEDAVRYQNKSLNIKSEGFTADTHEASQWCDPFKDGWTGWKKGAKISFLVKGSIIMIQWRRTINKPAPKAYAVIDGRYNERVILDANFDEDWGDLCALTTISSNAGSGLHTLDIVIDEEGREESPFMVISVISAGRD